MRWEKEKTGEELEEEDKEPESLVSDTQKHNTQAVASNLAARVHAVRRRLECKTSGALALQVVLPQLPW